MHLIRVGRRVISLRHLILVDHMDGESDPSSPILGGSRVVLETGVTFDLGRLDTEVLDRHLSAVVIPDPSEACTEPGAVAVHVDPVSGVVLPTRREGSEGG